MFNQVVDKYKSKLISKLIIDKLNLFIFSDYIVLTFFNDCIPCFYYYLYYIIIFTIIIIEKHL